MNLILLENFLTICRQNVPRKRNRGRESDIPRDKKLLMKENRRIYKRIRWDGTPTQQQRMRLQEYEQRLKMLHIRENKKEDDRPLKP